MGLQSRAKYLLLACVVAISLTILIMGFRSKFTTPITGESKIDPRSIPPAGAEVTPKSLGSSTNDITDYDYDSKGVLIKSTLARALTTTWGDEQGNPLYVEERTSLYYRDGPNIYGSYLATKVTSSFSWNESIGSGIGLTPVFSSCQITTIWQDNKTYCSVSIENKGNSGDVTLVVNIEVTKTGEVYAFSKVFHMDRNEKVKAVIHLPEGFPRSSVQVTRFGVPKEETLAESYLRVRQSLQGDVSNGDIDITS